MPIGVDLVLQEEKDPETVLLDGERLGHVIERSAERWQTPLAVPLMDLRLEKASLLSRLGVAAEDLDAAHLTQAPAEDAVAAIESESRPPELVRNRAHQGALRYIATRTRLEPVGMVIGPFSLMTKLLRDPITAVALAAQGIAGEDDPEVLLMERALRLSEAAVRQSVAAQLEAGARTVMVCEPAANRVYISPKQIARGSDVFERLVMQPNLRIRAQLETAGAALIFHDCGELTEFMVEQFATRLHPQVLSLGSSRRLWEDAAVTPKDVVLFGNLPTKNFYSDEAVPLERVPEMARELCARMAEAGHPHILGSECDVLHVPEYAQTIRAKVQAMLTA